MTEVEISVVVTCIFTIALIIIFVLCVFASYRDQFAKSLDKQIELGNKIFCYYCVMDSKTQETLIFGAKYRSFNDLVLVRAFWKGLRKIYVYEATKTINEVDCKIIYFANVSEEKPYYSVELAGEKLFNESEKSEDIYA